jgi:hypothetical protein
MTVGSGLLGCGPASLGKRLTFRRNVSLTSLHGPSTFEHEVTRAFEASGNTFLLKGPAADATDAPQPWRLIVQLYKKDNNEAFSAFPFHWSTGGMKLTGDVPGEKSVPVPLCPPQIPRGPTQEWTWVSAVRGRRLTAWAMARPREPLTQRCSCTSHNTGLLDRVAVEIYNSHRGNNCCVTCKVSDLRQKWEYC